MTSATNLLARNTLGKIFIRRQIDFSILFFQKTGFDISCKLSPLETICMECQILFAGKNKKNIINFLFANFAQRAVKVEVEMFFPASSSFKYI